MSHPLPGRAAAVRDFKTFRDALSDTWDHKHAWVTEEYHHTLFTLQRQLLDGKAHARVTLAESDQHGIADYRKAVELLESEFQRARAAAIAVHRDALSELVRWHTAALDSAEEAYRHLAGAAASAP